MSPCPPQSDLERLLGGDLTEAADSLIAAHVETCPDCQRLLEQWTAGHRLPAPEPVSEPRPDFLHALKIAPPGRGEEKPTYPREAEASAEEWPAIPGYEVLGELGRGGMGVVYKARQEGLDRVVALKLLLPALHAGAEDRRRFQREAEAVARAQHPHIVQVHHIGDWNGRLFLALEYVAGGTLADKLAGKPQPPADAARLVEMLAGAITSAHQCGIVHRDLKPANILLQEDLTPRRKDAKEDKEEKEEKEQPGPALPSSLASLRLGVRSSVVPKITDFGLAKRLDEVGQTRTGAVMGTPRYMAPEQAAGKSREVGPAADVWALGVILYEMLTGHPPFDGETVLDVLDNVRAIDPVPPRRLQPRIPNDLETICLKCLEKDPKKRYSAAALAEDLRLFLVGRPIRARPVQVLERLWRWCRRNPRLALLEVGVALLLVVIAVGASLAAYWWREKRDEAVNAHDDLELQTKATLNEQRRANEAERKAQTDRLNAYLGRLSKARAARLSHTSGQRLAALEALTEAAELFPSLKLSPDVVCDLRTEVAACLALTDLAPRQRVRTGPPENEPDNPVVVAIDPALERYASLSPAGELRALRVEDNREVLPPLPCPATRTLRVQFSPQGKFLAALEVAEATNDRLVHLWDLSSTESVRRGRRTIAADQWDFNAEGTQWAVLRADGTILIEDLASGRELRRLPPVPNASLISLSGRGDKIAVTVDQDVRVVNLDGSGSITLRHPGHATGLGWHPGGTYLAVACGDGKVHLWDTRGRFEWKVLSGHQSEPEQVVFSPDGRLLASAGRDWTLRVWDVGTGEELLRRPAYGRLRFSPDGSRLGFAATRWTVEICDVVQTGEFRTLPNAYSCTGPLGMDFSPDGSVLVTASGDCLHLWDVAAGQEAACVAGAGSTSVRFNPGSESLFAAGTFGLQSRQVYETPVAGGRLLHVTAPGTLLRPSPMLPSSPAISRDGKTVAVAVEGAEIVVFRGPGWSRRQTLAPHRNLRTVALSPDGALAATGTLYGRDIKVWDLRSGEVRANLPATSAEVGFTPDGSRLVAGLEGEYRSWETSTWGAGGLYLRCQDTHVPGPLAFSPDGRLLAVTPTPQTVRLVGPKTGREYLTLEAPHPAPIYSLCFSRDGSHLAAACPTRRVQLWDLRLLRGQLARRGLDWEHPVFPPAQPRASGPIRIEVAPSPGP